ncbi:MAG: HIT family protein [Actinomycetaceae bacterium]|nr:HIT family protein [Actinomycetaceae bacterium]
MASIFTQIINGKIPGKFVYSDEKCVAFLSIEPITPGHVLLVPREEVDTFWDAPLEVVAHMATVAQTISRALLRAYPEAQRVGQIVAGFDVPHLHEHLVALRNQDQLSFANAHPASQEELEVEAVKIRQALDDIGANSATSA